MILAAASQQQCKVHDLGIVHDNEQDIERVLENAISSGVDIIITSGGVSMGDRDFVKPLLGKKGKIYFDKVMMSPQYAMPSRHFMHLLFLILYE